MYYIGLTLELTSLNLHNFLTTDAERQLGVHVSNVVITVPAYFNDSQRDSVKLSAFLADLTVLKLISEPAAAALAFGSNINFDKERNVLVYDFGKFITIVMRLNEIINATQFNSIIIYRRRNV